MIVEVTATSVPVNTIDFKRIFCFKNLKNRKKFLKKNFKGYFMFLRIKNITTISFHRKCKLMKSVSYLHKLA